ncbi:hypothetical protein CXB51_029297 [Gossypium anomalum]|uniref:Aminotransferase-like plant mobile domain-containing protein n=1 Tax=Gossypium anomalum TaxID=47600 RepID=A0A8J6CQF1_9ROSI|nr:hypothetical protein CXB51_029297 [Gossypium anomalum]
MARELIRLDKHISVDQMTMRGGDPICTLFIFHTKSVLSLWKMCTITLEDVHLQLGLPMDGYAVTRSTSSTDWGAVCYELFSAISDNIKGGRIEMGWLRDTFPEPNNDLTELKRIQYARAYILEIIEGYLMPDLSRNLVHLRWLLKLVDFRAAGELSWGSVVLAILYKEMCGATRPNKTKIGGCLSLLQSWAQFCFPFLCTRVDHPYVFSLITRWNHSASYVGIPTSLEDIRLLLNQRSKAEFQWTLYEDPTIQAVIPDEFLQNPNAWHVKVPLVNYATLEMHQSDRDPWQTIFIVGRGEATTNSCPKGITGPFKSKKKGRRHRPINSAHTITRPNSSTDDTLIIAFLDYASPMAGWNPWAGSSSFPITPSQPQIYRPPLHEGSHEAPSGISSFYQSRSRYGKHLCHGRCKHHHIHYSIEVGYLPNT